MFMLLRSLRSVDSVDSANNVVNIVGANNVVNVCLSEAKTKRKRLQSQFIVSNIDYNLPKWGKRYT